MQTSTNPKPAAFSDALIWTTILGSPEDGTRSRRIQKQMRVQTEGIITQEVDVPPELEALFKKCKGFIRYDSRWLILDLNYFIDPVLFREFIDEVLSTWYYLVDMDYQDVMDTLYNFEKIELKRANIDIQVKNPYIKIASRIEKMSELRRSYYTKPKMGDDEKICSYYFWNRIAEQATSDGKIEEVPVVLDRDEFIAAMWQYGVRAGLDIANIEEAIETKRTGHVTIAKEKEPIPGNDARLEPLISFEESHGIKNGEMSWVDMRVHKMSVVQVEKDVPLCKKKPREPGVPGFALNGNILEPLPVSDIALGDFLGLGVREEIMGGATYIVSNQSGFLRVEKNGKDIVKIHVDKERVFPEGINMNTGIVDTKHDVYSMGDVTLDVRWKSLRIEGDVEANMRATDGDISVLWTISGTARSALVSDKHQQVTTESKGKITAEKGNISVRWHIHDGILEARSGKISIGSVDGSILRGKDIEISGDAINCIIAGKNVVVRWNTIGCQIVAEESIEVRETEDKRGFENIFSFFSPDLLAEKKLLLIQAEEKIHRIEKAVYESILKAFPKLSEKKDMEEKQMKEMRAFLEIFHNIALLQEEGYKKYVGSFDKLKPLFDKLSSVLDLLKENQKLAENLKLEISTGSNLEKSFSIKIQHVWGNPHVQRIQSTKSMGIWDYTYNELEKLSGSIAGTDTWEDCILEKIEVSSFLGFSWQSTPTKNSSHTT